LTRIDFDKFKDYNSIFDDVDGVRREYNEPPSSRYDFHEITGRRIPRALVEETLESQSYRSSIVHHLASTCVSKDHENAGFYRVQTSINSTTAYTTKRVPLERIKEVKKLHEDKIDYEAVFSAVHAPPYSGCGTIIELPEPTEEDDKFKNRAMSAQLLALLKLPTNR
jgi:hypothetical protein